MLSSLQQETHHLRIQSQSQFYFTLFGSFVLTHFRSKCTGEMLYFSKWLLWFVKKVNKVCVKKEKRNLHQTHDTPVFNKKGQMCCLDFKFKKKIHWSELSIFSQQNKKSLNTLQKITQRSYHVAILSADQYPRFIGEMFALLGQHKCSGWWAPSQKAANRATGVQEAFSSF